MMEKYGTDLTTLPPTDEQISIIKNLSGGEKIAFPMNRKAAEDLIEKLAKEGYHE